MCRFADSDSQKYVVVWEAIAAMIRSSAIQTPGPATAFAFSQYRNVLNEWLNPVPAIDDLERIRSRRLEDSCMWIEQNAIFQNWLDPNRFSVLLMEGPPGCGKSTVTTRVIELLQAEHPTAYFFCDAKDPDRQSWSQILRTWAWQLLLLKTHLVDDVFNILAETSGATTPLASYYEVLKCLVRKGKKVVLIVDGLDESKDMDSGMFGNALEELGNYAKIMVVSRPEAWVEKAVSNGKYPRSFGRVIVRPQSNATDITRLITQGIQSLDLDEEISRTIVDRLIQRANGMFLWAYLMLRHVSEVTTLAALDDLPEGLEDLYTRLMDRIMTLPRHQSRLARRVSQWTFSAVRQLSLAELSMALAVEPGSDHHNEFNTIHNLTATIRSCCSPLLEVDETRDVVRFVHASALEFLQKFGLQAAASSQLQTLPIVPDVRNHYTAAVCLTYLAYDSIKYVSDNEDTRVYDENLMVQIEANCFLEYCALNWWKHLPVLEGAFEAREGELWTSLSRFASSEVAIVKWIQLFQLLDGPRIGKIIGKESFQPHADQYRWISQAVSSKFSELWLAPSGLFARWDRWITESFFNGRHSTPIGIAAFFNFTDVISSELARGLNVDVRDSVGLTPLLHAAHGDAPDTLQRLLREGADVHATSHIGYGSVRYASRNCTTVLPLLLAEGASITSQERDEGFNALHAASLSVGWHPKVLEELLKRTTSEDLAVVDYVERTPLHIAAAIDLKTSADLIVGRLTEAGKPRRQIRAVSAQEAFTPVLATSAQIWALAWGWSSSSLEDANTSWQLRREVTVLVQKIKATMLSMLRQKSARVDLRDAFGQTPVHVAAETSLAGESLEYVDHDIDPVIQSLLGAEQMVECRNASGQRPLEIALARGSWPTAMTLLRADGANEVLGENARHSVEALIVQSELSGKKGRQYDGMFEAMTMAYQPKSLFEVLEASYVLQTRLSLAAPRGMLASDGGAKITGSILDFAEYWAISTTDASLNVNDFKGKTPSSASLRLGKGRVRKLEIYIARPLMRHGSRTIRHSQLHYRISADEIEPMMGCGVPTLRSSRSSDIEKHLEDLPSSPLFRSSVPSLARSSYRPRSREQNPFHKDGALLQLQRSQPRHKSGSARAGPADVRGESAPASKLVSAAPALWEHVRHETRSSSEQVWKQVWPLRLPAQQSTGSVDMEARQVRSWMESLKEGDEVTLSLSEKFFVEDIALYWKFGLIIYTTLV